MPKESVSEGLALSWHQACAPDLGEGGLPKNSEMKNSANGYWMISVYLLGLDFHYVSECRKILCR